MSTKAMAEQPLTSVLIESWDQVARKFADLAEEVPEEKFEWTPVAGLRTCGDIVRHMAFWNQYVRASLLGQEIDDSPNQLSAAEYPTASVRKQIQTNASPEQAWEALRDVGALHTRLVPGFVVDTRLEPGERIVTFGNGMLIREPIIDVSDELRRVAWSAIGEPLTHYNGSDFLPNDAAEQITPHDGTRYGGHEGDARQARRSVAGMKRQSGIGWKQGLTIAKTESLHPQSIHRRN